MTSILAVPEVFQDVSAMWEADAAAEWERQNTDSPEVEKMKSAADPMKDAYDNICNAMQSLYEAFKEAEGTVAEDRIVSLMDDLEVVQDDVMVLVSRLKKGEC